jgi:hypothetical protein
MIYPYRIEKTIFSSCFNGMQFGPVAAQQEERCDRNAEYVEHNHRNLHSYALRKSETQYRYSNAQGNIDRSKDCQCTATAAVEPKHGYTNCDCEQLLFSNTRQLFNVLRVQAPTTNDSASSTAARDQRRDTCLRVAVPCACTKTRARIASKSAFKCN